MECRFCLDIGGPDLIAPCRCTGSVQYIHKSCLRRWVVEGDSIHLDRLACSICKHPLYKLEGTAYPSTAIKYLLFNPISTSFVFQYVYMIASLHWDSRPFERFQTAQSYIHYTYALLYLTHFRVINWREYGQVVLDRKTYRFPALHILFLWLFYRHEVIMAALFANCVLTLYWHEHNAILGVINMNLIKN